MDNDDERDPAEEAYNAALLRPDDEIDIQTAIVVTFADGAQLCIRVQGEHLDDWQVFADMRENRYRVWTPCELVGGVNVEIRRE